MWETISRFEDVYAPDAFIKYRDTGTQQCLNEWDQNVPGFGITDLPIGRQEFGAGVTLHVPLMLSPVSVFHSCLLIGQGSYGINLAPCTLAGIYMGRILHWGHPDILADNPSNSVVQEFAISKPAITALHLTDGSISSWALGKYLRSCPAWPVKDFMGWRTDDWVGTAVSDAQAMTDALATIPYSIGYIESGQGVAAKLNEVNLMNKAKNWVNSRNSTISDASMMEATFPKDLDIAGNWVADQFINQDGEKIWPLIMGTYIILRQNSVFLGDAGGMLVQFIIDLLSDDTDSRMRSYGFYPLPAYMRANLQAQLLSGKVVTTGKNWTRGSATPTPEIVDNMANNTAKEALRVSTSALRAATSALHASWVALLLALIMMFGIVAGITIVWMDPARFSNTNNASLGVELMA